MSLLDVLAKELGFLMPKIIHKAAKKTWKAAWTFIFQVCKSYVKWLSNIERNVKE